MADEDAADPVALLDQAIRAMADFVRMLAAHTKACQEQGYSRKEAMQLTVAYQADMMLAMRSAESD